jgi:hypothetical protein
MEYDAHAVTYRERSARNCWGPSRPLPSTERHHRQRLWTLLLVASWYRKLTAALGERDKIVDDTETVFLLLMQILNTQLLLAQNNS